MILIHKHRNILWSTEALCCSNWGDNVLVIKSIMKFPVCGNCLDGGFLSYICIHSFLFLYVFFRSFVCISCAYTQNCRCLKPPKPKHTINIKRRLNMNECVTLNLCSHTIHTHISSKTFKYTHLVLPVLHAIRSTTTARSRPIGLFAWA